MFLSPLFKIQEDIYNVNLLTPLFYICLATIFSWLQRSGCKNIRKRQSNYEKHENERKVWLGNGIGRLTFYIIPEELFWPYIWNICPSLITVWTKLVCHHFVVPFSSWSRAIFLSFSVIKSYFPKKQLLPIIFIFTKSALRSICHMSKCATWNLELSPPAFLKGIRLSRRWLHTFYSSEGSHEKGAMTKTLDALKQPSCYVPCLLWLVTFPLLPIAFKIVLWFYDVRFLCPAK